MQTLQSQLPSQDWVEERANYIGGSDVATILGENPYSTPLQLWLRKRGVIPPIEDSPILRFGHFFEPILAQHFEDVTGLKTRQVNKTYQHPEHSFLRANIDRMVLADSSKGVESTAVLELKTTTSQRLKALDVEYPIEWILQIQHYLGITGYELAYLQVYERDTCVFHDPVLIQRDDNLIIENMDKLIQWWNTHMIEDKQPEAINGEDALLLYGTSDGSTVEATPEDYSLYKELVQVRDRKVELEEMEEHLKTKLKVRLENSESLVLAGYKLVSWKSSSQSRLTTGEFRKAHPELYKQFLHTTQTRRFLCH